MGEGAHDVVFADGAGSAAGGEPGCAVVLLVFRCVMSNDGGIGRKLTCTLHETRGRKVDS